MEWLNEPLGQDHSDLSAERRGLTYSQRVGSRDQTNSDWLRSFVRLGAFKKKVMLDP